VEKIVGTPVEMDKLVEEYIRAQRILHDTTYPVGSEAAATASVVTRILCRVWPLLLNVDIIGFKGETQTTVGIGANEDYDNYTAFQNIDEALLFVRHTLNRMSHPADYRRNLLTKVIEMACFRCGLGNQPAYDPNEGRWMHGKEECEATEIRDFLEWGKEENDG
jgi:hypothetical protein